MAAFNFNNASVVINSVDLSSHVTSLSLSQTADSLETTAMGDDSRTYIGGLKTGTCDITFNQDFAASQTEATIYPLIGTTTTVVVKADAGATSATNPSYTFTALVTEWPSLDGEVGTVPQSSVSWQITGDITKATS